VGVHLGGFAGVMRRVKMVAVRRVRVMRRLFVIASVVMFRGLLVMTCGQFVVLRRSSMVRCRSVRHQGLLFAGKRTNQVHQTGAMLELLRRSTAMLPDEPWRTSRPSTMKMTSSAMLVA